MATLEELVIQLSADTNELKTAMNSATKVVEDSSSKMEDAVKSFSENSSKNTGFFQHAMESMTGYLAADAIKEVLSFAKEGLQFLTETFKEGIAGAAAEEQALAGLVTSLRITGNATKDSASSMDDFTSKMETLAGVEQSVIQSNMTMLSSLTRLDEDGLKKATLSAIELSAATGKDLNTSMQAIAKAINGHGDGLQRMGFNLDLTTDKTKNLDIINKKFAEGLSGSAKAKMDTYAGSLFILQDAYGDLFKTLGKQVVENKVVIAAMASLAGVFTGLGNDASKSGDAIKTGIAVALIETIKLLALATDVVDSFTRKFVAGFQTAGLAVNVIADSLRAMVELMSGSDAPLFENTQKTFESLEQTISGSSALDTVSKGLQTVLDASEVAFGEMKAGAKSAGAELTNLGPKVVELTALQKAHKEEVKAFVAALVSSTTGITGNYELQMGLLQGLRDNQLMTDQTYYALSTQLLLDKQAAEQAAVEEWHATHLSSEAEYQLALTALHSKQVTESIALETKKKDAKKAQDAANLQTTADMFGNLATLSTSSNAQLASIGKAAAIAQATVSTYAGATKAFETVPYPLNFAAAGSIVVAGLANVAKITGTNLATGIDKVPGVGTKDNFPSILQPGERVVPAKTNQDLSNFLDNQTQGGQNITVNINIPNPIPIGREAAENMVEALNNYFQSGGLRLINT